MRSRKRKNWRLLSKQNCNILQSLGIADQYNRQRKKRIFSNDTMALEKHKTYFFCRRNLLFMGYREIQNIKKGPIDRLKGYLWNYFKDEFSNRLYFERIFKMVIVRYISGSNEDSFNQKYVPILKQCLLPPIADKMFFIFQQYVMKFYNQENKIKNTTTQTYKTPKIKKKIQKKNKSKGKLHVHNNTNILSFFGNRVKQQKDPQANGIKHFFKTKKTIQPESKLKKHTTSTDKSSIKKPRLISNLTISDDKDMRSNRGNNTFSFKKYFYIDCLGRTMKQKQHGIVINGGSGCGKRSFVEAFCKYYDYQMEKIDLCGYNKLKEVISKFSKATHQNDIQIKLPNKNSLSQFINNDHIKINNPQDESNTSSNCPVGVSCIQIEEPKEIKTKKDNRTRLKSNTIQNGLTIDYNNTHSLFAPTPKQLGQDNKKKIFLCTNLEFLIQKDYYRNQTGFRRSVQEFMDFVKKSNYLFVFCLDESYNFVFDGYESCFNFINMSSFNSRPELNLQVKIIIYLEKFFSKEKLKLSIFRNKQTSNDQFKYRQIIQGNLKKIEDYIEGNEEHLTKRVSDCINEFMIDQFLNKMDGNVGKIFANLKLYWSLFVNDKYKFQVECLETKSHKSLSMKDFFKKKIIEHRDLRLKDLLAKNRDFLLDSFVSLNYDTHQKPNHFNNTKFQIPFQKEISNIIRSDFNTSKCMQYGRIGYKNIYRIKELKSAHQILIYSDIINNKSKQSTTHCVDNIFVQEMLENQIFEDKKVIQSKSNFYEYTLQESILRQAKKS